jgi:hypothetical protein
MSCIRFSGAKKTLSILLVIQLLNLTYLGSLYLNLTKLLTHKKKVKYLLPINWRYVAWIDADIRFMNKNWVKETVEALRSGRAHFLQLFERVQQMGPLSPENTKPNITSPDTLFSQDSFGFRHLTFSTHSNDYDLGYRYFIFIRALEGSEIINC